MAIKIVLFLASILSLTVGAHLLFYKIVIRVFTITGPALKTLLLIVLLLLALSFMASFLLLQWHENPLKIGFYRFSATWIGLFLNLLPAVLASWIIIAAIRISGSYAPARLIAAICIVAAVLYSAYGVWNAFHPRIKKLIYKGYHYGFHHLSRFAIYTTSGVGTWGPPMRTGNSPEIVVMNFK